MVVIKMAATFVVLKRTPYKKDGIIPSSKTNTMGQSLEQNYLHIIFSTKYRQKLIYPPYEEELHAYIGGTCKKLGSPVLKVGGYTDHIHILCMLSKKLGPHDISTENKSQFFKMDENQR